MENTCHWDNCPFRKKMKLKKAEECPNFYENIFVSPKDEKIIVQDCAPIRTMLMVQDVFNRLIGLQKATEGQRNQIAGFLGAAGLAVRQIAEDTEVIEGEFTEA